MAVKSVETLEELAEVAMGRLKTFLSNDSPTSLEVGAARVASSVVGSYVKSKQTDGAKEALVVMAARELASDRAELEKHLSRALPSASYVRRMLPEGSSRP